MGFATAQTAIENRFATNFAGCPVKYQNVAYKPTPGTTFAELIVDDGGSRRAEIGGGLHRSWGLIVVKIYIPKGQGTVTGRGLADTAAAVFRDQQFSGITCRSPVVENAGESEEWYVVAMTCPFQHDEYY